MTASSGSRKSKIVRRLAITMVILAIIYTIGWFYAASRLRTAVTEALEQRNRAGVTTNCANLDFRGYPFRLGLFCSKLTINNDVQGTSLSLGELRSAAQIYAPRHLVWELDGPAEFSSAQGVALSVDWDRLKSNLVIGLNGLEQTSATIKNSKTSLMSSHTGKTISFDIAHTQIDLQRRDNDLDTIIAIRDLRVSPSEEFQNLPPVAIDASTTLFDKATLLGGRNKSLRGTKGEIKRLAADLGDGKIIAISGPFEFDEEGLLSGRFTLEIDQIDAWRDSIAQALPPLAGTVKNAAKLLKAMAVGGKRVSVPLVADHGDLTVSGFIPLGSIPPI